MADIPTSVFYSFVEVTVTVTEGQSNVNLHAQNLRITSVTLNETALAWGYREPSLLSLPEEWKTHKVKDVSADLAKRAFLQYKHIRGCTINTNLCIKLPMVIGATSPKELTIKVRLQRRRRVSSWASVQIAYSVENPVGFRFVENGGFTTTDCFDSVSCWMPCNVSNAKSTAFEFEIAVHPSEMVICSGRLIKATINEDRTQKIYHYSVTRPLLC